ncbi:MAG: hypothetical protein KZQ85_13330 [Candidatus Thiodiazotropha sp. (ex Myrtea sp. 'scaly one' KF741663)]|nr:hypothetical protein [Candidatus Thiodiazotropha sp. (ex Myrtea sp. 'scaly one' KF741663)]
MDDASKTYDKSVRKILDYPFWITHISWVIGWILMPSIYSVILYATAVVAAFLYIVSIGKFAKEIGKNPMLWSMLTLLFSPLGIWFSYLYSFTIVNEEGQ